MNESSGAKTSDKSPDQTSSAWDSFGNSDRAEAKTFQVAPGVNLEAEFKRLTGEDWPGKTYIAESDGADDDGYDSPIETWTIRKRTDEELGPKKGPDGDKTHEKDKDEERAKLEAMIASLSEEERAGHTVQEIIDEMTDEEKRRLLEEGGKKGDHDTSDRAKREAEERAKREAEECAKLEAEERAKREAEERAKLEAMVGGLTEEERAGHTAQEIIDEMTDEERRRLLDVSSRHRRPLVVINADFAHDRDELAHDLAERKLNQEASANWRSRLWKGTLFRSYYEAKYTREFAEGKSKTEVGGESLSVKELIERRKEGAIERFILGVSEDYSKEERARFVHSEAGEEITAADAETTAAIRGVIEKFASEWAKKNSTEFASIKSNKDIKREFQDEVERALAELRDKGKKQDRAMFGNYFEVAIQAAEASAHFSSMEEVMEGFKVYNAEVRDGVRTEAHRKNIDKVISWLERSAIGQIAPPEIVAGAVGFAGILGKYGVQSFARAAGVGVLASSITSGIREHNRVTEDRARMLRDAAEGVTYEGQDEDKAKSSKTAKYEAKIWGTQYDIKKASDLTAGLEKAMGMEDGEARRTALLQAIAEARVRIEFSDSERKDLISYSSADRRGQERLALDKATIEAERLLSEEDRKALGAAKSVIEKQVKGNVEEQDELFQRERAIVSLKRAGKTALIGGAVFFASQEAIALIDPNKIGLFEKYGIISRPNNDNAQETILANFVGSHIPTTGDGSEVIEGISGDRTDDIRILEERGYQKVETTPASSEVTRSFTDVDASQVQGVEVKYDGWANNGTGYSDGNELGLYIENGSVVSHMGGVSTMGGETFDYADLVSQGKIKGYLTIGGNKFEIEPHLDASGRLAWGENGVFTTTSGDTISSALSGDTLTGKYFEIAVDRGVGADGIQHIVPLATEVGSNSSSGDVRCLVETVIEKPAVFTFIKPPVVRNVTNVGVPFGVSARTGLGRASDPEISPNPSPSPAPAAPSNPAPATPSNPSPAASSPTTPSSNPSPTAPAAPSNPAPANPSPVASPSPTNTPADGGKPATSGESAPLSPSEQILARTRERATRENIPQRAIDFITESNSTGPSVYTSEKAAEYRAWWDAQDDDTKNKVIAIMKSIEKDPDFNSARWGNSFRAWLHQNHKDAFGD